MFHRGGPRRYLGFYFGVPDEYLRQGTEGLLCHCSGKISILHPSLSPPPYGIPGEHPLPLVTAAIRCAKRSIRLAC